MQEDEIVSLEYWAEKTRHKLERFVLWNCEIEKMTIEEWDLVFKDF